MHHIAASIDLQTHTGFYGDPIRDNKVQSWKLLKTPVVIIMGDFNQILSPDEILGGQTRPH